MALTFGGATTDRVDCGSAAIVDDLSALSVILWVYITTLTADRVFISKYRGGTEQGWQLSILGASANELDLYRERATTDQNYRSNTAPLSANTWLCLAAASDSSGANLYTGSLTALLSEVTYGISTAGSGAFNSDATRSLMIGNRDAPTPNGSIRGSIAYAALSNAKLTLPELQRWQFRPAVQPSMVGMWVLGYNGTSTQVDYSGNGNNGTVTGATVADHVPITFRRVGPLYVPYAVAVGGGGRTTKNTRAWPLGVEIGMNWRGIA